MKFIEIIDLVPEALNTTAQLLWSKNGNVFGAQFELDDRVYQIFIKHFDFTEFDVDGINDVYEVSFTGKDKTQKTASYKATGTNIQKGHNLKVFSIVKNSVEEKIKTLPYDVIFFDAKNTGDQYYSSRVKLYQHLTALFKKQFNLAAFSKEYSNFYLFVLAKQQPEEDAIDAIISLVARN
jgi:hypothetical protein